MKTTVFTVKNLLEPSVPRESLEMQIKASDAESKVVRVRVSNRCLTLALLSGAADADPPSPPVVACGTAASWRGSDWLVSPHLRLRSAPPQPPPSPVEAEPVQAAALWWPSVVNKQKQVPESLDGADLGSRAPGM